MGRDKSEQLDKLELVLYNLHKTTNKILDLQMKIFLLDFR